MNANMKRRFVFCLGAMLFAGTLAAQTPVPEWQAGVDKVKSLIKTNPEQASDAAGELLKGKNKKNVELVTSVARAYLDVGQLKEAETYLEMARKADNKAPAVSVLEGDIAFARKDIGKAIFGPKASNCLLPAAPVETESKRTFRSSPLACA